MKRVMRFAIRVHFKDEANPRYAWAGVGDRKDFVGTVGSAESANHYPYPGDALSVRNCSKLLKEAEGQWGSQAEIRMELVDMTALYQRRLEAAQANVRELSEMLGVT